MTRATHALKLLMEMAEAVSAVEAADTRGRQPGDIALAHRAEAALAALKVLNPDVVLELRVQLEMSQIELQGMRAALDGHAGTHSPYLWTGPAEHHSAWLSGQQAVQKYGADRYQMGFEKAQEVAALTQAGAGDQA